MRLAWPTKLPVIGVPVRGDGSSTLLPEVFPSTATISVVTEGIAKAASPKPSLGQRFENATQSVKNWIMSVLPFQRGPVAGTSHPFMLPEQKYWREQVEVYAESPFEKSLFYLKKRPNEYIVSKAWAEGLKSSDTLVRESALSLLKAYLAFNGMDNSVQISAHTQMKLILFSPHLTEKPLGKAILYEALLGLSLSQFLEFSAALKRDFHQLPPMAQALLLKQMMSARQKWEKDKGQKETDVAAMKKLVKSLVIDFYLGEQDALSQVLAKQEKIHLGYLKIQPVEEAYRKQLEELERRYRLKLRQLKKHRAQKVAEAEEEKLRRIELIYESVEGSLMSGLNEMDLQLDEMLVS